MSFTPLPPEEPNNYSQPTGSPLAPKQVGFGEAISHFYGNYANFSGRASRSQYWYASLFTTIVGAPIYLLAYVTGSTDPYTGTVQPNGTLNLIYILWVLANFIPSLAVAWRRLHDVNKSGGYYFIVLIPCVGAILLLVALCTGSDTNDNRFGPAR